MARDISMAAFFGDHPSVAAFMIAFRVSHFFRRLLGEGALQSIFIPHYQELRLKGEGEASSFFFQLTTLLSLLLILLIGITEGVCLFLPGKEVVHLFAWMLPSLLFICLYGLNTSVLQCQNSFFLSSVAPLVCNTVWVLSVFATASLPVSQAMIYLSLFTAVGFALQWLLTFSKTWSLFKEGRRLLSTPLFTLPSAMKTVGKATLFGLIGIAAVQINSFVDMIFAHYADPKGPVYLWYAIRLQQLPLALIGFACVYSVIPHLSKLIKQHALPEAQDLFAFGERRIFLFVIPCTFALIALGLASVNLLFGRGHFSPAAVSETTFCLFAYGLSLLPITLTVYHSSLFFAYGDYKTPTYASLISVGVNLILNALFVFVFHLGAISIALSTSLSACLNYLILRKRFLSWPRLPSPLFQICRYSLIALCGCQILDHILLEAPRALPGQLLHFLGQALTFSSLFSLSLVLFHRKLFFEIKDLILSRDN